MRIAKLFLILGVVGVVAIAASATAVASVIDVTAGTTLFYDDFESQPSDQISHGGYPDTSGDYDPVASGWTGLYEDASGYNIQVTDASGANGPGAYQGANYLRIGRTPTYSDCPYAEAGFAAPDISHTIRLEQMMHLTSDDAGAMQIWITKADGNPDMVLRTNAGAVQAYCSDNPGDGFKTIDGLSYSLNQWQKWRVDWTPSTGLWTTTIGDGTPVTSDVAESRGAVAAIAFSKGYSSPFGMDEVPEPSSTVLVVSSLVGLLAYAWRKRR